MLTVRHGTRALPPQARFGTSLFRACPSNYGLYYKVIEQKDGVSHKRADITIVLEFSYI